MENRLLNMLLTVGLSAVAAYFNALSVPVVVLIAAMTVDYASGMTAAWILSGMSSRKGIKGIIKKVSYMALVAVAMGVDYIICCMMTIVHMELPQTMFFGLLVTIWLIINELISILENLGKIGVPIPPFLKKVINRLKISTEDKGEEASKDD